MVCFPSSSLSASPSSRPCMQFQYWLAAIGMFDMVKYLFSSSKVAEQPPRLAQTTLAPTFIVLSKDVLLDDNEKKFGYGEQQKETEESSFDDRLRVIFEECDSLLENLPKGLSDEEKEILPPVAVLWSALKKYLEK